MRTPYLLLAHLALSTFTLALCGCPDATEPGLADMSAEDLGDSRRDLGSDSLDQSRPPADMGNAPDQDTPPGPDQGKDPIDLGSKPDMTEPLPTSLDLAQDMRRELLAEIMCDIAFGCPSLDYDYLVVRGRYADRQTCKDGITQDFGFPADEAVEQIAVTSQRGVFDVDAAQRCIEGLRAEVKEDDVCQDPEGFEEALIAAGCDDLVKGQVPEAGDCLSSADCADEAAYCDDLDDPLNQTCLGTCYTFVLPKTCDPGCDEDQLCDEGTLTCVRRRGFMQSCGSSDDCLPDLFCGINVMGDENVCLRRVEIADTCNFDVECVQEAFCDFTPDKPICVALRQLGEPCTEYGQCAGDAFCDIPNDINDPRVCVVEMPPPARVLNVVGMGAPCGLVGNPLDLCESGLACINLTPNPEGIPRGVCGLAQDMGASCTQDSECAYPLRCDDAQTCTMPEMAADGEACDYSETCASAFCDPVTRLCASSSMCVYMMDE
jgi:hypothetical protein